MLVVCDAEFNGLDPSKVWVIVCKNPSTKEVWTFEGHQLEEFAEFAKGITCWVGHYFIKYDAPNLSRLVPGLTIDPHTVLDTCVVSKVLNFGIEGGHSVEAWGLRLRLPVQKVQVSQWDQWDPIFIERCRADVEIQCAIYEWMQKYLVHPAFVEAIRLEHDMEIVAREMHDNGFPFDVPAAKAFKTELSQRLDQLDAGLRADFPPVTKVKATITPRETDHGTIHATDLRRLLAASYPLSDIQTGRSYDITETVEFNPGSLKQIIERLWEAGWKPTEKTKGHAEATAGKRRAEPATAEQMARFKRYGWKLSEDNLRTLPDTAPASAKRLVERLLLASRVGDLAEWLALVRRDSDGVDRIHATFNAIGAWTQRLSTNDPNLQNIPVPQGKKNPSELDKLSDELSARARALFVPEPGCVLVGTDAEGIQMRIFAHYVQDQRLIAALVAPDGDIHTLHWNALGSACKGRQPAKTFIYAWLLGAGAGKVAEILECTVAQAKGAIDNFLAFYPGLTKLKKEVIPGDAARGYFVGLDGRFVVCGDPHYVLAGYLQNGEVVIMKRAQRIWARELADRGIWYRLHTWPHDEWQTSCRPEDADAVGTIQANSIRQAAAELGTNLAFAGKYKVGKTWLQTH